MIDLEDEVDFLRRRESAERALACATVDPCVRDIHLKMAGMYAEKLAEPCRATQDGGEDLSGHPDHLLIASSRNEAVSAEKIKLRVKAKGSTIILRA